MAIKQHNVSQQNDFQQASFGGFGCEYLTGTASLEAGSVANAITALTSTTFTTLNNDCPFGDADLSAITIPAGVTLYGRFDDITLAAGDLICYLIESNE